MSLARPYATRHINGKIYPAYVWLKEGTKRPGYLTLEEYELRKGQRT